MPIARVHDPLSQTLINKLGVAGGPRADQVGAELDSLITGVNDVESDVADILTGTTRIDNVRYCVHRNTNTVGNVGTGEDNLHSISLAAGSLATNGDYVVGEASGRYAANGNTKTVRFKVDGTTQAAIPIANGSQGWVCRYKIIRLTSTSVRISCTLEANVLQVNSGSPGTVGLCTGYAVQINNADEAVSDLAANALVILVTGESSAASNDDVTQNMSILELCQQ